jgi:hypothetical protein
MPKRTRTQKVEEELRRAFAGALDERFLFRDDVADLGIDGSVEEFDHDDHATGLCCYATERDRERPAALDPDRAPNLYNYRYRCRC